jgi:hypothetical protein
MKAWQLDRLGGTLSFNDVPVPEPRPGSVLVRIEAQAPMSYMKDYVEGKLPMYNPPKGAFTPGGNGVRQDRSLPYTVELTGEGAGDKEKSRGGVNYLLNLLYIFLSMYREYSQIK